MTHDERNHIEALFRMHYTLLTRLALRKSANKEQAEELVQSVFMIACIKSTELLHHPNPIGWLVKTMQFLILKAQQAKSHESVSLDECYTEPASVMELPLETLFPPTLTQHEKLALHMRIADCASYQDIAATLDLSEANCRKVVSRALKKCRAEYING